MARRTCFNQQYYTDTRRYNTAREDCRQYEAETMYKCLSFYHQYLRIHKVVWARVLCGTRYYHCASFDCDGGLWPGASRSVLAGPSASWQILYLSWLALARPGGTWCIQKTRFCKMSVMRGTLTHFNLSHMDFLGDHPGRI